MGRFGIFILLLFSLFGGQAALAKPHEGVTYVKTVAGGLPLHLVDVDLSRSDLVIRPVVVPAGHRESFDALTSRHRPVVAVNGTFFDTKTGITVGNLVAQGRLLSEGMTGSNLVLEKDGSVKLLSSSRNLGRYQDWSQVECAVGAGPTLIASGNFFMDPRGEGFRDPSLFTPRPRSAIGVTEDGHLRVVVVTKPVTLWQLAKAMKALHCYHAINLDGGSSTGLSVGGSTMVRPSRKLTNIVGVFASHMEPQLDRAVGVAQRRAMAHYQKGLRYLSSGHLRLARSQMRQAVSKAPEQAAFWRAAGEAELKLGYPEQAVRDLHQASQIYFRRGDYASALELANKVLEIQPHDKAAHLMAGECELELNREDRADGHVRAVLQMAPGHPKAVALLKNVKARQKERAQALVDLFAGPYNFLTSTLPIE